MKLMSQCLTLVGVAALLAEFLRGGGGYEYVCKPNMV